MCAPGTNCGCGGLGAYRSLPTRPPSWMQGFGACGDPGWLTLPSGESVTAICGGGLVEVCVGSHVRRWGEQARKLQSALNRWRATMVTASQTSGDVSIAAPLVSEYGKWFQRYQDTPREPHWAQLGNDDRAQALASLVQDGACLLQQMQQETYRLDPSKRPKVDPGAPTPGPAPGFNDPFMFAGILFLAYLLATQVDW